MLLVVGLVIMRLGGLQARDLGLVPSKLKVAALCTMALWLVVQVIEQHAYRDHTGSAAADPRADAPRNSPRACS